MIWVCIHGGVMGFDLEEIEAMEKEYMMLPHEFIDYWGFFNWYFSDEMGSHEAFAYSALWNDQETYKRMSAHTEPGFVWGRKKKRHYTQKRDHRNKQWPSTVQTRVIARKHISHT